MKITKSRLIQIIKEEIDKERVDKEKKDALDAMLALSEDGRLEDHQLVALFPGSDPQVIEDKLEKLLKIKSYRDALKYLLDEQEPIDPEGNPLEFSS